MARETQKKIVLIICLPMVVGVWHSLPPLQQYQYNNTGVTVDPRIVLLHLYLLCTVRSSLHVMIGTKCVNHV